jgi:hypothetical protein
MVVTQAIDAQHQIATLPSHDGVTAAGLGEDAVAIT